MAWTQTRNNIIARALRICGVISVNQTPTATQYSNGADALNAILASLDNSGYRGSQIDKTSVATVDGTTSYQSETDTTDIMMGYMTDSSSDQPPLTTMTQEQYYGNLDDKDDKGLPTHIYIENKEDPLIFLYPTPDAIYTLNYIRIKKVDSIDNPAESIDLEKRWWEPITFRLAEDLGDEYNVPEEKIRRLFSKAKALVKDAKKLEFYRQKGNEISQSAYSDMSNFDI